MNVVTVGELGHCALGFYGGHWSPKADAILAHCYGGSFHLWKNVGVDSENWKPLKVPSGHHAVVSDIGWPKSRKFLLSVSHDQTTRIYAPWFNHVGDMNSWCEIDRPQVHGHDINCVAIVQGKGNHRFVCGADEKVARVFEAPLSFLKTLNCAVSRDSDIPDDNSQDVQILGANMSALGLSQKPIYVNATQEHSERANSDMMDSLETVPEAVPVTFSEPPIEDQLAWHTLWPESHKLYGHGNELFSLCCDHGGKLVASSCKAQSVSVAELWLWEVGSWKAVGRLQSHSLTVTQMAFSYDDSLLLSVSRDRHFSVFSINTKVSLPYPGSVWTVEPTMGFSRLGWRVEPLNSGPFQVRPKMMVWSPSPPPRLTAEVVSRLDPFMSHASTVQRLAWRNPESTEDCSSVQLASCGADHCVRVFEVNVGQ